MVASLKKQEEELNDIINRLDSPISHCIKCGINLAGYTAEATYCRDCAIELCNKESHQIICEELSGLKDDLHDLIRTLLNYDMATAYGIWLYFSMHRSVIGVRCKQCAACKFIDGVHAIFHGEDYKNDSLDLRQSFKDLQNYFHL